VDRACGTYGGKESCIQGFSEDLMKKEHLEDLVEDRRLILKWTFEKWNWNFT
jgi:hypothetical protein